MLGAFRLFLAALVVLSHLVNAPFYHHLGFYAVRAFFILSSFAMTAALHERYQFDGKRFWLNRLLRLAPIYLATCLLTSLAIQAFPAETAHFMPRWGFAATLGDVLQNLFIVPVVFLGPDRLIFIEPAWSLAVEIVMYSALFIFVARSAACALYAFALSFYFHLMTTLNGVPFEQKYFSVEGALLSFSIGALAYFWTRGRRTLTPQTAFFLIAAWIVHLFAEGTLAPNGYPEGAGFYVNVLLATLAIVSLSSLQTGAMVRRLDAFLGDLSYPVFLVQWLGGFVGYMLIEGVALRGWMLVLASAPPILLLAAALAWLQTRFVEPLRRRVRHGEPPHALPAPISPPPVLQPAE